jgi:hypothetical protein
VWGKTSYSECLNTRGDFYGFIVIIRKKRLSLFGSYSNVTDNFWYYKMHKNNFFELIWNYLNAASLPNFCGVSPNLQRERPNSSPPHPPLVERNVGHGLYVA